MNKSTSNEFSGQGGDGEHFSVSIVGDGSTGKSSIINAFKTEGFLPVYKQTIGIEFYEKCLQIRGDLTVYLRIWDVGGQSINSKNLEKYVSNSNVVFLVYDVTNAESFQNMDDWLQTVRKHAKSKPQKLYLVGNKIDLYNLRVVTEKQHDAFVRDNKLAGGLFVSARTGENVVRTFNQVAAELLGVHLTPQELAYFDKVLKVYVAPSNDAIEGRTSMAEEIEAEDRALEEAKKRAEEQGGCRCSIS